jgi:muramidase (phage lysozyme)
MSKPITPAERQWLNLISYAEGTWNPKSGPQYNMMFTGKRFNDLRRHPDIVNKSPGYASSAAGAYQFLTPTWRGVSQQEGLKDFGPRSQDLGALRLIRQRGVDPARDPITPQTIAKLAPVWASLPTLQGRSFHGQPVKSYGTLVNFLKQQGGFVPQNVAPAAPQLPPATGSNQNQSSTGSSEEERLIAESLSRSLLDSTLKPLFKTQGAVGISQLAPPPLPSDSEEEQPIADEGDTESLLLALSERLGDIEDAVVEISGPNPAQSEALRTQERMQQLMRSAQQAFQPGVSVI